MVAWQNTPCAFCAESLGHNWKLVEQTRGRVSLVLHRDCLESIRRLRAKQSSTRTYYHQWSMFHLFRFTHDNQSYVIFS